MEKSNLLNYLGGEVSSQFEGLDEDIVKEIEEIRLRINKPILIYIKNKEYSIKEGKLYFDNVHKGYVVHNIDIKKTLELMSNYSMYAYKEELKNGYITLPGGHRVGICGKTVIENGSVKTIGNVNGLNIRMSHEVFGCADDVIDYIALPEIGHTLIISPPACGKTTLIRDISRQLSNGVNGKIKGVTVGIVDERSEIAGSFMGTPQNDVGMRTDVLDGCPKAEGMIMFLRSMAPKVIMVDEIGSLQDVQAIENIINAGVKIICTIHGYSLEDVLSKPNMRGLLENKTFDRYILLKYKKIPGFIEEIYNKDFEPIKKGD